MSLKDIIEQSEGRIELIDVQIPVPVPTNEYTNTNGKTVHRYEITALSLRDAMNQIPGDFKVYWWNQDRTEFTIEIVRTF